MKPFAVSDAPIRLATTEPTSFGMGSPQSMMCLARGPNVEPEAFSALRPGQLIGDVSAYSGLASPADVVARGPGILAKWDLRHVREFTASRPELRANLLRIVSMDLAAKLRDIANPSLGAEELVPKLSPGGTSEA